ncbi:hypothetical protein HGM15179_008991 [Zosterops borbonicus]|uniref:Uncharacterized protein n=1 Tax=Zosterops borbonicus TaxID=364589 RepID=A0A8K1GHC7_9PASS|nr:hypothetical protein HGM15179_008991 [Zosterops borbonicus]
MPDTHPRDGWLWKTLDEIGGTAECYCKVTQTISGKILIWNLMKYGLDGQTVRIVRWLKGQAQSVMVDNGAEYALSKSAADTELRGVADMPEGYAAIQRDIDCLEEPQEVQQKELQIPAPEEGQPQKFMCQYKLEAVSWKATLQKRPWGY